MDKDTMKCFIGKVIKVDRGGPESKIGMLMDASDDLIVLLTEDDGLVYYNSKHIRSFTDNIKGSMKLSIEVPKDFKFIKAANFKELLDSLKFKWIKINRGGPEKLEGVLTEVENDSVFLINNQEIVRLSLIHIRSISYGLIVEKAEEEKADKQKSHNKDGKSNESNKNKNNKTNNKKRTSQKKSTDNAEMALAYPLSSQETMVEDIESDLSIPLETVETLQETTVEDVESDLSIPFETVETLLETTVEDVESNLSNPLATMETAQETAVEDTHDDLSVLFSTLEKILRKYV
ncbi:hypothetical protein [Neobacillus drentensis]|uniref:hypothetical protein n=1 Tax=Neobacillus drentensis TaxID=220684 RepID=UPI000BF8B21D|nr:hypothetical protein CN481_19065 [Bacillus sp. AFS006103]